VDLVLTFLLTLQSVHSQSAVNFRIYR
jgi:hypothetical protein